MCLPSPPCPVPSSPAHVHPPHPPLLWGGQQENASAGAEASFHPTVVQLEKMKLELFYFSSYCPAWKLNHWQQLLGVSSLLLNLIPWPLHKEQGKYGSVGPVGCCFSLLFVYQLGDFLLHFQEAKISESCMILWTLDAFFKSLKYLSARPDGKEGTRLGFFLSLSVKTQKQMNLDMTL